MARPRFLLTIALTTVCIGVTACTSGTESTTTEQATDSAPSACTERPSAHNTGATGSLTPRASTEVHDGEVVRDAAIGALEISGSDVSVSNVAVTGEVLVTGDRVTLDHISATGIAISSARNVTVLHANIAAGPDDAIHITSDRGRMVSQIRLESNYIHDPNLAESAHYDGTQIRGADSVVIRCSTYDPGPYRSTYNAAIFLENANGGDRNVIIENNWLGSFGFSVMLDAPGTVVRDNIIIAQPHWDYCFLGGDVSSSALSQSGNATAAGDPVTLCSASSASSGHPPTSSS